jgi:hypothetical protein
MNEIFSNIKKHLLVVLLPTVLLVILSISCLKDIEKAFVRFRFGRDITLYLRKSTDHLTYLGAAYTATGDKKFIEQFNTHLKEREKYLKNKYPAVKKAYEQYSLMLKLAESGEL